MKRLAIALSALLIAVPAPAHSKGIEEAACARWKPLMRKYGLPVKVFLPIAYRESRCQPRVIGWNYKPGKGPEDCKLAPAAVYRRCRAVSSFDSGLFQINSSWVTVTAEVCGSRRGDLSVLLEPTCNTRVAARLYDEGRGLSNWAYSSGK
jgi:hypothetical protein